MNKTLGFIVIALGASSLAMAASVPEIDPASGVNALAVLAGSILVIRGRRKK